jgi:hypothetical protein
MVFKLPFLSPPTQIVPSITEDKNFVKQQVEKHGGVYSPSLEAGKVTHLLAVQPEGKK